MSKEKFYITTAIAYTSKKPHIGNTYEIVLTDAIARFNRFIGKDVFFLTGTDEHGQKIQEIAENEGITPKQHVDKIAGQIKDIACLISAMINLSVQPTIITLRLFSRFLKSFMIKVIFIRVNMKVGTVHLVNHSGLKHSL